MLFSEFFKGENRSKMGFSVSFTQVLDIREMRLILVGGCLKNVADFYQYSLLGATSEIKGDDSFSPFYFGLIGGMVIAGLSNDLLFKECQTLIVTVINLLTITWNFWDIVYPAHN